MRDKIRKLGHAKLSLYIFFVLIAMVAFANGMSDSIINNYFKDSYNVDATQRAFLEFPRELPGVLCLVVISLLSFFGDVKTALIAQVLSCVGIAVLGLITPEFAVMSIFLFVYSLGMHMFMPLSDSIGMSLAEPEKLGSRIGQFGSIKTAAAFLAGILVFFGFRFEWFSFKIDTKWAFIISAIGYALSALLVIFLVFSTRKSKNLSKGRKLKFVFRKEYTLYYCLTILHGVQKQIAILYGSWVIIDLLSKGADVMSILIMLGSLLGIFFFRVVGKWIDTKGIRFVMFLDALSFIFVYTLYGFVVWGINANFFANITVATIIVYALFILDRLSMQVGVVKSVYLKRIAVSEEEVTATLSTGISLDHVVSIIAAQVSGVIWVFWGPQWVFFFAAFFSLGNLFIAYLMPKDKVS